jgi:hypothetical protein
VERLLGEDGRTVYKFTKNPDAADGIESYNLYQRVNGQTVKLNEKPIIVK